MKYTIQVIPQEYTVEAECADHAMIAVASYIGNNNIRLKSKRHPVKDMEMMKNLVDLDDLKQKKIKWIIDNQQESLAAAVNTVKIKPQRKFSN